MLEIGRWLLTTRWILLANSCVLIARADAVGEQAFRQQYPRCWLRSNSQFDQTTALLGL